VLVADGGDFLSFARVGLSASTYLDPGSLGCIGVGTAFGVAASLACPGRQVVVATGDGAFGFNAMEIDTAVRHGARLLIVVANNGAWQIEVSDQTDRYGEVVGTRLQFADHAAMARAFGMHGQRVERVEDLDGAITTALQHLPALLDVVVSTQPRSSDSRSGLAWVPDLQAVEAWDLAERQWRAPSWPVAGTLMTSTDVRRRPQPAVLEHSMKFPQDAPFVLAYEGVHPTLKGPVRRSEPGSAVLGRVTLGGQAVLERHAVLRGDGHVIDIGSEFHLGVHSTVHIAHAVYGTTIGERVTVGANSTVHACTVGDDCVVQDCVSVLDGAVIGNGSVVAAGSVVFPRSVLPLDNGVKACLRCRSGPCRPPNCARCTNACGRRREPGRRRRQPRPAADGDPGLRRRLRRGHRDRRGNDTHGRGQQHLVRLRRRGRRRPRRDHRQRQQRSGQLGAALQRAAGDDR